MDDDETVFAVIEGCFCGVAVFEDEEYTLTVAVACNCALETGERVVDRAWLGVTIATTLIRGDGVGDKGCVIDAVEFCV